MGTLFLNLIFYLFFNFFWYLIVSIKKCNLHLYAYLVYSAILVNLSLPMVFVWSLGFFIHNMSSMQLFEMKEIRVCCTLTNDMRGSRLWLCEIYTLDPTEKGLNATGWRPHRRPDPCALVG